MERRTRCSWKRCCWSAERSIIERSGGGADNNVRGELRAFSWSEGKKTVTDDVAEDAVKAASGRDLHDTRVQCCRGVWKPSDEVRGICHCEGGREQQC